VSDDLIGIDGYSIVRQDRNTGGGGVALYVRDTFKVKLLASSNTAMPGKPMVPEYLMCRVWQEGAPPIFVAVIYRPNKTIPFNANSLLADLRVQCEEYSHKIIMGDLNANLLSSDADALFVNEISQELSLRIVPHGATHHTESTDTWIDVILVDAEDVVLDSGRETPNFRSHHDLIHVTIQLAVPSIPTDTFTYRNYKKAYPLPTYHNSYNHATGRFSRPLIGRWTLNQACIASQPIFRELLRRLRL
jgi:hypothetical protein